MKIVTIACLTAFLCCYGVQSTSLPSELEQRILNSGTVVFLDFLEKVRNATERLVRENQFRKSRIIVQGYMKDLREFAKSIRNPESAGGSRDNPATSPQRFVSSAVVTFGQVTQEVFDKYFFPYINIYRETLKNGTMLDIWKEVDSYYLPGAPPIYNKPMEFFSFLLAKALLKSQMVNMLEAGVDLVNDIGKIDFNQLHEEAQLVMDEVRNKAREISALERQNEKNDLLVSLRTVSALIVFYWDKVLEQTESMLFHAEFLDSMKRWAELTDLRETSEKYHVLFKPETRQEFWNWTERHFSEFFDDASQEYYRRGNEALGLERFNKSNWAVAKSAVIYTLPVYEKLSEVGFGLTEINSFLNKADNITLILEGRDATSRRKTFWEDLTRFILHVLGSVIEDEKAKMKDSQLFLPLRLVWTLCIGTWDMTVRFQTFVMSEKEVRQSESEWNNTKIIIIEELVKSQAFTREQLEELPNNFNQTIHQILEILQQYTDVVNVDGLNKIMNMTILVVKAWLHYYNDMLLELWDLLLE